MSAFTPPYPPFHTLAQMFTLLPPSLYGLTLTIPSPTLMRNRSFSHTHTHTSSHFTHIHTYTHLYHATQVLIVTRSHTHRLSLHVFVPALIHTPTCLHAYPHTLLTTYTHSVRPTTRYWFYLFWSIWNETGRNTGKRQKERQITLSGPIDIASWNIPAYGSVVHGFTF